MKSQLGDDVQLHAISRSAYRRRDQCNFPSQARTNVCQRRADVLEMLNDGDNQIYMYSDAQECVFILKLILRFRKQKISKFSNLKCILIYIKNLYLNTKSQHTMSLNQEKRLALHLQRKLFTVSASATYRTVAPENEVSQVKMVGKVKLEG